MLTGDAERGLERLYKFVMDARYFGSLSSSTYTTLFFSLQIFPLTLKFYRKIREHLTVITLLFLIYQGGSIIQHHEALVAPALPQHDIWCGSKLHCADGKRRSTYSAL
jgi:hypothetical protein